MHPVTLSILLLLIAGCSSVERTADVAQREAESQPVTPFSAPRLTEAAYCAAVKLDHLYSLNGDLVTRCTSNDPDGVQLDCELMRVGGDGSFEMLARDVQEAWPLGEGRQLRWLTDGSLEIVGDGGPERIAEAAASPSIDAEARRIAFLEPVNPAHVTADGIEMGVPTRLIVYDRASGTRRVPTDDTQASNPIFIPGTPEGMLYVSSKYGTARVWRIGVGREYAPRHTYSLFGLTNLEGRTQTNVPPPANQVVWYEGKLVYSISQRLLVLDPKTGETTRHAPGWWPRLDKSGALMAMAPERCPARYNIGRKG